MTFLWMSCDGIQYLFMEEDEYDMIWSPWIGQEELRMVKLEDEEDRHTTRSSS